MARTKVILCSIISLTILVAVILIACSFSVLNYNEVGLNYSTWFKVIENKTYEHGIHFIGLGHAFHRYEVSLTTIEFSGDKGATLPVIKCRTRDGLELDLEISLQYKVQSSNVYEIYTTYGENEKTILNRVILDVISDTSTLYSSNDFFTLRAIIQNKMKTDLQEQVLAKTFHEVVFFQLRSLNLPDAFENEIKNTEVKGQDINTANAELLRDTVMFQTSVKVANLAVNATVETAYGEGNKTVYQAQAEASTISEVIQAQSIAYKGMKANLTFDNDQIMKYLQNSLIKDYQVGKITVAVDL